MSMTPHAQTQSSQEPEEHDFFREKILETTIDVLKVQSEENIVDIFTKSFSKTSFEIQDNIQKITLRRVLKSTIIRVFGNLGV